MAEHWVFAKELVSVLTAFLYEQDDDGMDMYFTSSTTAFGSFSKPGDFVKAMSEMCPKPAPMAKATHPPDKLPDERDIRDVLEHILRLWRSKYQRKLTLLVLTDGVWPNIAEKRTVANLIVSFLEKWADKKGPKDLLQERGLSIQFIQLGSDEAAREEFEYMDDKLTGSGGLNLP